VEGGERSGLPEGLIRERAIGGCVDGEDKRRKIDQHAGVVGPDETATTLFEMGAKAVQRHREARNVESVPHQNSLTIEGDNGRPPSKNREVGAVAHANPQVGSRFVGYKRRFVWKHMVRGARVSNGETAGRCRSNRRTGQP